MDPATGAGRRWMGERTWHMSGMPTGDEEIDRATRLGFVCTGRSAIDGQGRPYPLIHLRSAPAG
jgi:hypothetical protein